MPHTRPAADWDQATANAPYRASLSADHDWDVRRPSPHLAVRMRVCPGGRILAAFTLEAIRDYFVAGHADQGAQIEADGATRATALIKTPRPVAVALTLDEIFEQFKAADRIYEAAEAGLKKAFQDPAERLWAQGKPRDALALIKALPSESTARAVAFGHFVREHHWDTQALPLQGVEAAAPNVARAQAMLAWKRAELGLASATQTMTAQLEPLVEGCVRRGDRDALGKLIERTPPCVERAFMVDALNHRMRTPPVQDTGVMPSETEVSRKRRSRRPG